MTKFQKIKDIRFQKLGKYGAAIFIANAMREPVAYKQLSKWHQMLDHKFPNTFLPIYATTDYATIRLKGRNFKFDANDVYDISFTIRFKQSDIKTFVNCFVDTTTLVSKAPPIDLGDEFDLSE